MRHLALVLVVYSSLGYAMDDVPMYPVQSNEYRQLEQPIQQPEFKPIECPKPNLELERLSDKVLDLETKVRGQ